MKLSMKWLCDFLDIGVSIKDFCDAMTMTGTKVETVDQEGGKIDKIVTGKVESIEKHPDADKLLVCMLNVGDGDLLQIVTGAKNLKVGDIVPVALDGSTLFDGTKIKKGKLRGILSCGMLCSLSELGLGINDFPSAVEDGIFVLEQQCKLGENIKDIIGFNDTVVDFEITPNRPDCLSVIGLAREAAATFKKPLKINAPQLKKGNDSGNEKLNVTVENAELCPYYSAQVVKNVKVGSSPSWLRERLRAMGVRSVNNIVDITNYVMLEYGQPLHAFDLQTVKNQEINVRCAKSGEKIVTLDGTERMLNAGNLVIADGEKPIAIAGVMGGKDSGVTEKTTAVVFECANFCGPCVRKTAKEQNIRTDSSSLYEKGLDPNNCPVALERACELLESLNAGVVDGKVVVCGNLPSAKIKIKLDVEFINSFLNINLPEEEMVKTLVSLGCEIEDGTIIVPTFRKDLSNKYDIAEEIARFYGYNNIKSTNLSGCSFGALTKKQHFRRKISSIMLSMGASETVTYPFVSPKHYDKILLPENHELNDAVVIKNPLGEDTSIMRTTMVVSMLDVLSKNFKNKNKNVSLFEIGREYRPKSNKELPEEREKLVAGFYGENVDFFYVKGIAEELLSCIKLKNYDVKACEIEPYYHPGKCAEFTLMDGTGIGMVGEINPQVCDNYDIKDRVYVLDFDINVLFENARFSVKYKQVPKFPSVVRDIALVCDEDVPVLNLQKIIADNAKRFIEEIAIFDIYTGEQIPKGKKSVAFTLTLRSGSGTLTENEVNATIEKIVKSLGEYGVELRKI